MAEQRDLVGERHFRRQVVVRMDVDVPQSGHQPSAAQVDRGGAIRRGRAAIGADLGNTSILDQDRRTSTALGWTQSISVAFMRRVRTGCLLAFVVNSERSFDGPSQAG
jgi:hypothetical protein